MNAAVETVKATVEVNDGRINQRPIQHQAVAALEDTAHHVRTNEEHCAK